MCLLDACATVRDIHESWREGPHGIEAYSPGQKSVGRETFHSCPPAMGDRDGPMRPARSRTAPHRPCGRHEGVSL